MPKYIKKSEESEKEASKAASLLSVERSVTKSTPASTLRMKQTQVTRLLDEIAKIQSQRAALSRKMAEEDGRLGKARDALAKKEESERKKITADKRREREQLSHQRSITNELRSQYTLQKTPRAPNAMPIRPVKYDVSVSHASEDKEDFVKPLVLALQEAGHKVWYDEFTLKVGASPNSFSSQYPRGWTVGKYVADLEKAWKGR